ncbi:MAG: ExeM/NucH family extracellular endonuclease, partial [Pseudomonadota bacterium]
NVLNYFTTIDDGSATVATGLDPRGADDLTRFSGQLPASDDPNAEFDRQTEKLVEQLLTIDADVLGLIELENDFMEGSSGNALENLVNELNLVSGAGTYDWVRPVAEDGSMPQSVGTDAIMQGIIYKPAEVSLVGDSAFLVFEEASAATTFALADVLNQFASSNDQVGDFQRNRPAIAATFEDNETGETFTVAVNHFKSKGDSNLEDVIGDAMGMADQADIDALIADPNFDQGDGAAFWNQVRVDAAEELVAWLESDPTNSGDPDYIILGDLNAYAQEEPVTTIEALGYTDLAEQFVGDDGYSFVFDGQLGTLDYALANASLTAQVTGATEWHVNVDEPDAIDYNLDFGRDASIFDGTVPFRASDHDPIIVGLDLESGPVTPPADEFEELPLFAFADDDGGRFQVGGGSIGGLL